jgi:DNA polymerase-3 subunit epsilon/CBS domain-containing protein
LQRAGWQDAARAEIRVAALARLDTWPYRHRAGDIMRTPPLIAPAKAALSQIVDLLFEHGASSAFIDLGSGYGIITERDMLRAFRQAGPGAADRPAGSLASAPLECVADEAFLYEAIGRMRRRNFRHLGVVDSSGKLVGALSQRDMLRLRADAAVALTDGIGEAAGVLALATVWRNLTGAVRGLIAEEADPRDAAAIISGEVCALTRRAAELAVRELNEAAPLKFCLMVLGSAGRGESLLAMDQDNAIVFEDGGSGAGSGEWLDRFAVRMNAILDEVGVPLCKGGVMARNLVWRKSSSEWRRQIAAWLSRSEREDVINADIFFDAVPVYGEATLGEELLRDAAAAAKASQLFLKLMSRNAALVDSPFGWFGRWRLEDGRFDLKKDGLLPVFSVARVLALQHGNSQRSTPARLEAVRDRVDAHRELIGRLLEAHRIVLGTILAQQLLDIERGVPPSNRVDPHQLSEVAVERLRWALGEIANVGDLLDIPPA